MPKISALDIYRASVKDLLQAFVKDRKAFVAEAKASGMTDAGIRKQGAEKLSRWNFQRDKLKRNVKSRTGIMINQIEKMSYMGIYKPKKKDIT